jgi:hypothetical protein
LLGVCARTALPYLRKARAQQIEWSHRYTASAVASFILCLIATALVFPLFTVPEDFFLQVLLSAFAFGFGVDSAFIETAEWVFPKRTEE